MTVEWMLGAIVCGALLGMAALAAEPVAGWFRLPRRWIWVGAMAGAVLLPLAAVAAPNLLPRLRVPVLATILPQPVPAAVLGPGVSAASPAPAFTQPSPLSEPQLLPAAILIAWLVASLATLGTLVWARRRVRRACRPCVVERVEGTWLVVSERAGPMVLGVFRPFIVLPRWVVDQPETCRMIVRHEREHIGAGDPLLLVMAALAVAALPWSPALWWMHRRLRLAVETDCDARVLATGESRRGYLEALLGTAQYRSFAAAGLLTWGGRRSHLEHRLRAITTPRPRLRLVRAVPLAVLACAGAAVACRVAADSVTLPAHGEPAEALRPSAFVPTPGPSDTAIVIEETSNGKLTASFAAHARRRWFVPEQPGDRGLEVVGIVQRFPDVDARPVVESVRPASPAERAGVRAGDRLVRVNGHDARGPGSPAARFTGEWFTIEVVRGEGREAVTAIIPGPVVRSLAERSLRARAACFREAVSAAPRNPDVRPCFALHRDLPEASTTARR